MEWDKTSLMTVRSDLTIFKCVDKKRGREGQGVLKFCLTTAGGINSLRTIIVVPLS